MKIARRLSVAIFCAGLVGRTPVVSAQAPAEMPQRVASEFLRLADRRVLPPEPGAGAYAAAYCGAAQVVVLYERPFRVALYDSTGRRLWLQTRQRPTDSIRCNDDTIALLERGDGWSIQLLRLTNGRERASASIETMVGDHVALLGWTGEAWALEVLTRFSNTGVVEASPFQRRTVRLFNPRDNTVASAFTRVDSTPQVVPKVGGGGSRLPVRPPFAPTPSIAVDRRGRFFTSTGRERAVEIVDASGARTASIALPDTAPPRSSAQISQLIAQWHRTFRAVWPDSLRAQAVALDEGWQRVIVGQLLTSRTGVLLAQRRDFEDNPLSRDAERLFDVFDATGRLRGRLRVPIGTTIMDLTDDTVLAIRRVSGPLNAGTQVIIASLQMTESAARDSVRE